MTLWISVKDSTPTEDQYVLAYDPGTHPCIGINWYSTFGNRWMKSRNVSHWMTLPPFPEEES